MWWVGWGVVVDTDALLSSSPSLIWLQLGFGLAGAVTIKLISSITAVLNGNLSSLKKTSYYGLMCVVLNIEYSARI